jgi:DNA gyrase subunit A
VIEGITDLRDESDREGIRVVMDVRRDANTELILNQLFAHTQLESSYGIINLAIVNNEPKTLTLKEMLELYLEHRVEIVTRRTKFELTNAKNRLHILSGLVIALQNIDDVIKIIRESERIVDAKSSLQRNFDLSEQQITAILDLRLQKLTRLEMKNVTDEIDELTKKVARLESILKSRKEILAIIKSELMEIKEKYGDERRTQICTDVYEVVIEDLIPQMDVVVTLTKAGYVKRLPLKSYKVQRRGGKGLIGIEPKADDYVVSMFVTSTHDYILFFTNTGKCYWLKAYKIPDESRYSKGKPIINLLPRLRKDEKVRATIPIKEFSEDKYLIFVTRNGTVKKTVLSAFKRPKISGIRSINLAKNDELVDVLLSTGTDEVMIGTKSGYAVRFDETDVRSMGRSTTGVRGIRLRKDDVVISATICKPDSYLLSITQKGFGKLTHISKYRKTRRGSYGVISAKTTEKTGSIVALMDVKMDDELIITTVEGMVIRVPVGNVRITGRSAMGVKIMTLKPDDKIIAVERLVHT